MVLAVLGGAALLLLQRPDAVLNAQFWAEDGAIFYADAYHLGALRTLLEPYNGSLQLFPRAVAGLATLAPFALAPLLMDLAALLVATIPGALLLSGRLDRALPDARARVALAAAYVLQPAGYEVVANVANGQWHLGVIAGLLVVSDPARSRLGAIAETGALLLAALTGPLVLLLAPIALLATWLRDRRVLDLRNTVLVAGALIQGATLLWSGRPDGGVGASWPLLAWILGVRVFLGAFLGDAACLAARSEGPVVATLLALIASAVGLAYVAHGVARASAAVRQFAGFAGAVLIASLVSPLAPWRDLAACGNGSGYWFIPCFAVLVLAASAWSRGGRGERALAAGAALLLAIGVVAARVAPPLALEDLDFPAAARAFEQAPPGSTVVIGINPPGWRMVLRKR